MDTTMRDVLIETYNLGALSTDKQDVMIEQIGGLIFQSILVRVIPMLGELKQAEFEKLLADDVTPEGLLAFLTSEIPNFGDIVKEEAVNFKKESDEVMNKVG